ncbi:MAG: hypothetical protein MZV64_36655 [Ignavibacteriales bacterium]|nr:hypothetical protein [Ignavibacteriales bacterium]
MDFHAASFSDLAKTGIGGSAIGEFAFNEQVSVTLSASYQNFPGEGEGFAVQGEVYDFSVNAIPVLAGVRYYFSKEFFGTLEAGVHFLELLQIYTMFIVKRKFQQIMKLNMVVELVQDIDTDLQNHLSSRFLVHIKLFRMNLILFSSDWYFDFAG